MPLVETEVIYTILGQKVDPLTARNVLDDLLKLFPDVDKRIKDKPAVPQPRNVKGFVVRE